MSLCPVDAARVELTIGYVTQPRRRLLGVLAATLLTSSLAVVTGAKAQTPQTQLPRLQLRAGMHLIDAQLALTPQQRSVGLMWRREMAPNEGMLFAFEVPATQCFWMKNTLLPLTAAFVRDDGSITNLVDMQPQSLESHCSMEPVRFVLEMQQGWFQRRGLKAGSRLAGEPFHNR